MVVTHHISPVATSLGKWEIQGRNKLWRNNLERKWQSGYGKQGFVSVIMSDTTFVPNRQLVWSSEGRQKLGAGRETKKSRRLKSFWVGIPVSCFTSPCQGFTFLLSTHPLLREFLVIHTGKQLQPLNCTQQVQFIATSHWGHRGKEMWDRIFNCLDLPVP